MVAPPQRFEPVIESGSSSLQLASERFDGFRQGAPLSRGPRARDLDGHEVEGSAGLGGELVGAVNDVDPSLGPRGLDLDVPLGQDKVVLLGLRSEPCGQGSGFAKVSDGPLKGDELTEQPDLLVLAKAGCPSEKVVVTLQGDAERALHLLAPLQLVGHRPQERVGLVLNAAGINGQTEPHGLLAQLLEEVRMDNPVGGDIDVRAGRGGPQGQLPADRVDTQDAGRGVTDPLLAGDAGGHVGGQRLRGEGGRVPAGAVSHGFVLSGPRGS